MCIRDSYSIIQMPPGIPVATVAINGAMNAAILAIQMLALSNAELAEAFAAYKDCLLYTSFNYRGYSAQETISRWPSVRSGEDKWIFPYQENADVMFNSALLFEFAVLRCHAEPILTSVPRNCPEYAEAYRLMKFIKYFTPVQAVSYTHLDVYKRQDLDLSAFSAFFLA